MVREDTTNPSLLNNSRRQMKNVIPTPKYERRQPRGKSMDRGRLLSFFFNSLTHLLLDKFLFFLEINISRKFVLIL